MVSTPLSTDEVRAYIAKNRDRHLSIKFFFGLFDGVRLAGRCHCTTPCWEENCRLR